jgi:ATP-dependent Clp protease ATP-binding subunit ClpA
MNEGSAGQPELNAELLALAQAEARRFRHKYVRAEHLLLALLRQTGSPAAQRLQAAGVTYAAFSARVSGLNCPVCAAEEKLELAEVAKRAVQAAQRFAGQVPPDSLDLLRGILQVSPLVRKMLADTGLQHGEWIQD